LAAHGEAMAEQSNESRGTAVVLLSAEVQGNGKVPYRNGIVGWRSTEFCIGKAEHSEALAWYCSDVKRSRIAW